MCTSIVVKTPGGDVFMGRTMDFSHVLKPQLYAVPAGFEWNNLLNTHKVRNRYRFLGVGQDLSSVIFADGVNEMGFGAAALYFPGFAQYDPVEAPHSALLPVAALEIVKFLLGLAASVEQAVSLLRSVRIVGVRDSVTDSVAPLHWILADKSGQCITVEKTADGIQFMENSIGVLANSPDFRWHMINLRNYMNVEPEQKENEKWGPVELTPFGQGAGTLGLPGDYAPPSRFVRAAYLKSHTYFPDSRDEAVTACFHVMESVSIPKGVVVTSQGTEDYTQYTVFADLSASEYFFRTYDNSQIIRAGLPDLENGGNAMLSLGKLFGTQTLI